MSGPLGRELDDASVESEIELSIDVERLEGGEFLGLEDLPLSGSSGRLVAKASRPKWPVFWIPDPLATGFRGKKRELRLVVAKFTS